MDNSMENIISIFMVLFLIVACSLITVFFAVQVSHFFLILSSKHFFLILVSKRNDLQPFNSQTWHTRCLVFSSQYKMLTVQGIFSLSYS